MTFIPKTQEPHYDRKLRLLEEKLGQIQEAVEKKDKAALVKLPDANEAIPNAVHAAFAYVHMYQRATIPMSVATDLDMEVFSRRPHDSEEEALSRACELLVDYFDRNNSRIVAARQAPKPKGNKRTGIKVGEDFDECG